MRTRLLLLLAVRLLLPAALAAQSSVWRVESGGHTLYLGGTFHLLRPQDFPLPPEFDAAFAAADELWFETDIAALQSPATAARLLRDGVYHDGTTLDQVLAPDAWAAVQAYCARAGLDPANMARMKPGAFMIMVANLELARAGISQEGVDLRMFRAAQAAGKPTHGLETIDQHLDLLFGLGAGHENEVIRDALDEIEDLTGPMERLITAWRTGDLEGMDREMLAEMRREYPTVFSQLIVRRNAAWMAKIDAMLASAPVEFVLVGAGHLAGDTGLVARLRARGCAVTPVRVARGAAVEERPPRPAAAAAPGE